MTTSTTRMSGSTSSLWQYAAACLRDALIRVDPENAAGYQERGDALITEFAELDRLGPRAEWRPCPRTAGCW